MLLAIVAYTLSRLINLELKEPNSLKKEGYKYGYTMF